MKDDIILKGVVSTPPETVDTVARMEALFDFAREYAIAYGFKNVAEEATSCVNVMDATMDAWRLSPTAHWSW
jgi:hypothetical protein